MNVIAQRWSDIQRRSATWHLFRYNDGGNNCRIWEPRSLSYHYIRFLVVADLWIDKNNDGGNGDINVTTIRDCQGSLYRGSAHKRGMEFTYTLIELDWSSWERYSTIVRHMLGNSYPPWKLYIYIVVAKEYRPLLVRRRLVADIRYNDTVIHALE